MPAPKGNIPWNKGTSKGWKDFLCTIRVAKYGLGIMSAKNNV